ncbi:hypothetical protein [Streptomyces sp. NPDC056188]|uniref:hypothetical protein n=1 Tax=Streptomyces sp. NPDC056188 TaxID=3345740 RepID=UPI0035D90FCD
MTSWSGSPRDRAVQLGEPAVVIARRDAQIAAMAMQLADCMDTFERQARELAKLQHLHLRDSSNSSMPPSKDDAPGKVPPGKERRAKPGGRGKGKQKGVPGSAGRQAHVPQQRFPGR